jgi:hypothetical protein
MKKVSTKSKSIADKTTKPKKQSAFNPFVPTTVDNGLRSLLVQFGETEVKAALKRATSRIGNLPIKEDWPKLAKIYFEDSQTWLAGGDPLKSRSSHSIATLIASEEAAHKRPSIYRRILRKLKSDRKFYTYYIASIEAEKNHPYALYGKAIAAALRASSLLQKQADSTTWKKSLLISKKRFNRAISVYVERHEAHPESILSLKQIEEKNVKLALMGSKKPMGPGLFGIGGLLGVTK